jgi:cell fate regulator YaaT (PSP1 superfamily)
MGTVLTKPLRVEDESVRARVGRILRAASQEDLDRAERIRDEHEPAEMLYCREKIRELSLPMRLATVEHLFGGEKIVFYFRSDGRVDFRALVRDLAREYRTRIEMRQIGVRDEARLISDYEHCGRPLCCKAFMQGIEPVTMRMAKLQKTTLDPAKISGCCGRLMCCLRFEDDVYRELRKGLPPRGAIVSTGEVTGEVRGAEVLSQKVIVRTADGNEVMVPLSQVVSQDGAEVAHAAEGDGTGADAEAEEAEEPSADAIVPPEAEGPVQVYEEEPPADQGGSAGGGDAPPPTRKDGEGTKR